MMLHLKKISTESIRLNILFCYKCRIKIKFLYDYIIILVIALKFNLNNLLNIFTYQNLYNNLLALA